MAAVGDPRNTATKIRDANHQAMRDRLMAYPLLAKVFERIEKLDDGVGSLDANSVAAIKAANDASLKLLAKVLPDLKAVEHSGAIEAAIMPVGRVQIEVIGANTPHQGD